MALVIWAGQVGLFTETGRNAFGPPWAGLLSLGLVLLFVELSRQNWKDMRKTRAREKRIISLLGGELKQLSKETMGIAKWKSFDQVRIEDMQYYGVYFGVTLLSSMPAIAAWVCSERSVWEILKYCC